jgi:rSAM/selenodomain-associated transferase 1
MARAPVPGRAKTRLEPLLGPEGCARLQAELIRRAAGWAAAAAPGAAFVAYTPEEERDRVAGLVPAGVELFPQLGDDLGGRMRTAFEHAFDLGHSPVLMVGTDSPQLGAGHAAAALEWLGLGCDVCLGPALDGGYYLIALRAPQPALFELDADLWGGHEVLERSIEAAERAGLRTGLLQRERDLDTSEDARAMLADGALSAEVAKLLRPAAVP